MTEIADRNNVSRKFAHKQKTIANQGLDKDMLQRKQPEEGEEISEADILARRQEMMGEIDKERTEFIQERQQDVVKMKLELSSSSSFQTERKKR